MRNSISTRPVLPLVFFSQLLSFILLSCPLIGHTDGPDLTGPERTVEAYLRSYPRIEKRLALKNLELGSPVFIRIFKKSKELEVWIKNKRDVFEHYKTFIICHHSGNLGPKRAEGDHQSPEGFYLIGRTQMNPLSDYHLAFNLGYPNNYDRAHGRTGGALMVHGRCSSVGCFAMTDYYMDEIYTLADRALSSGQQEFQVHIFPFRLTPAHLADQSTSPWLPFWENLKEGYDYFERNRKLPIIGVKSKKYVFFPPASDQIAARVQK